MTDYPFYAVVKDADVKIAMGWAVYQKWTCSHCGARQTMETPNVFYKLGECEECEQITDIETNGCNFMAVISIEERTK